MRLHRFIREFDLSRDTAAIHDAALISQWKNVLRLAPGDSVILCDGRGSEAEAVIERLARDEAAVRIVSRAERAEEGRKKASLFCALLKRENFELAAQKAVETGISRIVPLLTERTVKTGFNRDRLEKIIREAAEQSGRTILPELAEPMPLAEAIAAADPEQTVFFDLSGSPTRPADFKETTAAFVGPEGGFTEEETAAARKRGIRIASLGAFTLRGETAAIVAAYLICN